MSDVKCFMENSQGVHLMNAIGGSEHSVCGDSFDAGSESDGEDMWDTDKKVVTCPECIAEILNCRNVRIKQ